MCCCLDGLTQTIMIRLWQFSDQMEKLGGDSDGRGGHGSVHNSKVSHFTFVWLVSKNLGHG